jgi:predicted permease
VSTGRRGASGRPRLYDLLLYAYPLGFRRRFGDAMRDTFAEEHRRLAGSGLSTRALFWTHAVLEAAWFGCRERCTSRARGATASPKGSIMSRLVLDWRDAWRSLRATPLVTAVAVLSLALGVGANTALFSVLNSLVLKPLPVAHPEQLVMIDDGSWTNPIWEQIRDRQTDLAAGALAWSEARFDLASQGESDFVDGTYASGGMFEMLGLTPLRGRLLTPADDAPGGGSAAVAVVSYGFWQRRFGGAENIVGQPITISRVPFTIVGVMPRAFGGPEIGRASDLVVPMAAERLIRGSDSMLDNRAAWWLQIMLRLRPGQTLEQAAGRLAAVQPQIRHATMPPQYPPDARDRYLQEPLRLVPAANGDSGLRSRFQQPLTAMLIVVGAVLLIACANIANLLLARATARRRDLSVRLALGASRGRVARQLAAESLLIAGTGAALGLLFARSASAALVAQLSTLNGTVVIDTSIDWRVLAFTGAVGALTAVIFGTAPALGSMRVSPGEALKEQTRTIAGDRRFGLRNTLAVIQVALSLVLVVAAGLFVQTFRALSAVPLGMNVDPLVVARVNISRSPVERAERVALFERLRDAAAAVPGVASAALSDIEPLSGAGWNTRISLPDSLAGRAGVRAPWVNAVTPGWFETYGLDVLAGRDFTAEDRAGRPNVAIVNRQFAERFFGGARPVGRRFSAGLLGPRSQQTFEIVGLVSDSVYRSPRDGTPATIFVPFSQIEDAPADATITLAVAGNQPAAALERQVAAALTATDPAAAFTLHPLRERVRGVVTQERLIAVLSGFFGGLALLLAGLGLYGITAYGVNRRRAEIGVRMALGAAAPEVVRLVLGRALWLVGIGVLLGAGAAWWLARFVGASLLFGLQPRDVRTFVTAAAILAVVGLAAGWLPARRASRIDPTEVLREG